MSNLLQTVLLGGLIGVVMGLWRVVWKQSIEIGILQFRVATLSQKVNAVDWTRMGDQVEIDHP